MVVTTFDTLKYANTLKAAGVPDKQAEAQATVLSDALAVNLKDLATKDDLRTTEERLNARIDMTEQRLNGPIELLRAEMSGQFKLLYWMGGIGITLIVGVLVRLFFKT